MGRMMAEPIEENQHEEDMGDNEPEEEQEMVRPLGNNSGPHIAEIDEEQHQEGEDEEDEEEEEEDQMTMQQQL